MLYCYKDLRQALEFHLFANMNISICTKVSIFARFGPLNKTDVKEITFFRLLFHLSDLKGLKILLKMNEWMWFWLPEPHFWTLSSLVLWPRIMGNVVLLLNQFTSSGIALFSKLDCSNTTCEELYHLNTGNKNLFVTNNNLLPPDMSVSSSHNRYLVFPSFNL